MRNEDIERVVEEVVSRVLQQKIQIVFEGKVSLERIINDTIYHERKRLENDKKTRGNKQELIYWKQINRRLLNASEEEQKKILKELITRFAVEIVGHFKEKVYRLVTRSMPKFISFFLNMMSPKLWLKYFPRYANLDRLIKIRGEVDMLKSLSEIGTTILVPTHSSNMDSIIVGLALYRMGLPPYCYGAGLNLFQSSPRIIRYFMFNLGAYKVDRKKTASLYKDVLKEYATVSMEFGYHNLFFPGGTRSRSGALEQKLKLGLMGTSITAYINNLKQKKEKPNIFIVPCTISYHLVLEAERLMEDFLKETGKSRYIIEDDEFSQPRRIVNYLSSLLYLDSSVYITIAQPLDLFGNRVDEKGISYDKRGRPVDISRYTLIDRKVEHDIQRDRQYITELGNEIAGLYIRYNVIMSIHMVAFVIHRYMVDHNPEMDLYRLLRTGGKEENMPIRDICDRLGQLFERLKEMEKKNEIRIDDHLREKDTEFILEHALRHFSVYHSKKVIFRRGDRLYPNDTNLIYYYHNRLIGYNLEQ